MLDITLNFRLAIVDDSCLRVEATKLALTVAEQYVFTVAERTGLQVHATDSFLPCPDTVPGSPVGSGGSDKTS
jgi:hypothetical protein